MKLTSYIYRFIMVFWKIQPFKKITSQMLRSSRLPIQKLKSDLWFDGFFSVKYFNKKIKLHADKLDKSALSVFWDGLDKGWDAKSIYIWGEIAKKSQVAFDIGSNIGLYCIAAKVINPDCEVFAFEPSRKMYDHLNRNVKANNLKISTVPVALSNFNGEVDFYDLDTPTAVASLKHNENLRNENSISYKVQVSTLKKFVEERKINKIDLISIDVEMNESEVLEGMGELIEQFRPNFIIEVLNNEIGLKIESFFQGLDYVYFCIDEKNGLFQTNSLKRVDELEHSHGCNFLICSKAIAADLNDSYFKLR